MLFAIDSVLVETALWNGLSQLAVLAIVGFVANIVIRRFRAVSIARQELLDAIDEFSIHFYKPRKIYQIMIDRSDELLAGICNAEQRETCRLEALHQALSDLVDASGRVRTFQVKIIQLYGYDVDLLAHYLAIWRYLKEIRHRMEKGASLLSATDKPDSGDAFYRLFDSFRYRVSVAKYAWRSPGLIQPPADVLKEIRIAGDLVYSKYFGVSPVSA
jgi:hypothetical protein